MTAAANADLGFGESSSPPGPIIAPPDTRCDGPTLGIAPVCDDAAVAIEKAAGAARHDTIASAATDRAAVGTKRPETSSSTAAPTPPTATVARSHGIHSV